MRNMMFIGVLLLVAACLPRPDFPYDNHMEQAISQNWERNAMIESHNPRFSQGENATSYKLQDFTAGELLPQANISQ